MMIKGENLFIYQQKEDKYNRIYGLKGHDIQEIGPSKLTKLTFQGAQNFFQFPINIQRILNLNYYPSKFVGWEICVKEYNIDINKDRSGYFLGFWHYRT